MTHYSEKPMKVYLLKVQFLFFIKEVQNVLLNPIYST